MSATSNVFLLAADNSPSLLPLLRANPTLASSQDAHGYSLVHAAASYNHLDLLEILIRELKVDVNIKDEDGETALFVVETVDCAKLLVETLGADITVRGEEAKTAREKFAEENEFPQVAVYLRKIEIEREIYGPEGVPPPESEAKPESELQAPAPLPEGVTVDIGSMMPEDAGELVDSEFRKKIEELAARDDFQGEEGQKALRGLIVEALGGITEEERTVRPRHD